MGRTDDQPIGALAGVDRSDAWVPEGATASRDEGGKAVYAMGKRVTLGQHPPGAKPGFKPAAGKAKPKPKVAPAPGSDEGEDPKKLLIGLVALILFAVVAVKFMGGNESTDNGPTSSASSSTESGGGMGGLGHGAGDAGE